MIQNKERSEVRDSTDRAARVAGYVLITLGVIVGAAFALAPLWERTAGGPWFLSPLFMAVGIPLAFPRSAVGHAIVGRFDKLLDKLIPGGDS